MPIVQATGTASGDSFTCGAEIRSFVFTYKYKEGSILYPCYKANLGILEAICIKSVRLVTSGTSVLSVIYKDTFNRLWDEDELCNETDAKNAAIAYLQDLQNKIISELQKCGN